MSEAKFAQQSMNPADLMLEMLLNSKHPVYPVMEDLEPSDSYAAFKRKVGKFVQHKGYCFYSTVRDDEAEHDKKLAHLRRLCMDGVLSSRGEPLIESMLFRVIDESLPDPDYRKLTKDEIDFESFNKAREYFNSPATAR